MYCEKCEHEHGVIWLRADLVVVDLVDVFSAARFGWAWEELIQGQ